MKIIEYQKLYYDDLLRLLLELHTHYFFESASPKIQELRKEKDAEKAYSDYINYIIIDKSWQTFLAIGTENKVVGFIIGSLEIDESLINGKIGKLEDWFVEKEFRGQGIGAQLYATLEKWFTENSCQQIVSDTWPGNNPGIKAHEKLGFFVSGIVFTKKLNTGL